MADLLYIPFSVIILYVIYVLLKPQSEADEFFHLHKNLSQQALIRRIELLGHFHKKDFSKEKETINRYFLDGNLSDKELENLENLITRAYFDGFHKRWSVFLRADWAEKGVFLASLCSAIMTVAVVMSYAQHKSPDLSDFMYGLLLAVILFPFTYAMVLIILGLLSFVLSIFRFIFPVRGSLLKATIFSEEFVKALKPGGRSTEVVLPKSSIFPGGVGF
jgi:hypothetical protein